LVFSYKILTNIHEQWEYGQKKKFIELMNTPNSRCKIAMISTNQNTAPWVYNAATHFPVLPVSAIGVKCRSLLANEETKIMICSHTLGLSIL